MEEEDEGYDEEEGYDDDTVTSEVTIELSDEQLLKELKEKVITIDSDIKKGALGGAASNRGASDKYEMTARSALVNEIIARDESSPFYQKVRKFAGTRIDSDGSIVEPTMSIAKDGKVCIRNLKMSTHRDGGDALMELMVHLKFATEREIEKRFDQDTWRTERGVDSFGFVEIDLRWGFEQRCEFETIPVRIIQQAKLHGEGATGETSDLTTFLEKHSEMVRRNANHSGQQHMVLAVLASNRALPDRGSWSTRERQWEEAADRMFMHCKPESDAEPVTQLYEHQEPLVAKMLATLSKRTIESVHFERATTNAANSQRYCQLGSDDLRPKSAVADEACGAGKTVQAAKIANGEARHLVPDGSEAGKRSVITIALVHEASKGEETMEEFKRHAPLCHRDGEFANLTHTNTEDFSCRGEAQLRSAQDNCSRLVRQGVELCREASATHPVVFANTFRSDTATLTLRQLNALFRDTVLPPTTLFLDEYDLAIKKADLMAEIGGLQRKGAIVLYMSATNKRMYMNPGDYEARRLTRMHHNGLECCNQKDLDTWTFRMVGDDQKVEARALAKEELENLCYADVQFRNASVDSNVATFSWHDGARVGTMAKLLRLVPANQHDGDGQLIDYRQPQAQAIATARMIETHNLKRGFFCVKNEGKQPGYAPRGNAERVRMHLVNELHRVGKRAWVVIVTSYFGWTSRQLKYIKTKWLTDDEYDVYIVIVKHMLVRGHDTRAAEFLVDATDMDLSDTAQGDGRILRTPDLFIFKISYVLVFNSKRYEVHVGALAGRRTDVQQNTSMLETWPMAGKKRVVGAVSRARKQIIVQARMKRKKSDFSADCSNRVSKRESLEDCCGSRNDEKDEGEVSDTPNDDDALDDKDEIFEFQRRVKHIAEMRCVEVRPDTTAETGCVVNEHPDDQYVSENFEGGRLPVIAGQEVVFVETITDEALSELKWRMKKSDGPRSRTVVLCIDDAARRDRVKKVMHKKYLTAYDMLNTEEKDALVPVTRDDLGQLPVCFSYYLDGVSKMLLLNGQPARGGINFIWGVLNGTFGADAKYALADGMRCNNANASPIYLSADALARIRRKWPTLDTMCKQCEARTHPKSKAAQLEQKARVLARYGFHTGLDGNVRGKYAEHAARRKAEIAAAMPHLVADAEFDVWWTAALAKVGALLGRAKLSCAMVNLPAWPTVKDEIIRMTKPVVDAKTALDAAIGTTDASEAAARAAYASAVAALAPTYDAFFAERVNAFRTALTTDAQGVSTGKGKRKREAKQAAAEESGEESE